MANIGIDLPASSGSTDPAVIALLTSIDASLAGAQRAINTVESLADGVTPVGVQSCSIFFRGDNGTLLGVAVPNGFMANWAPNKGADTIDSIKYTVPTTGEARVIISYTG